MQESLPPRWPPTAYFQFCERFFDPYSFLLRHLDTFAYALFPW